MRLEYAVGDPLGQVTKRLFLEAQEELPVMSRLLGRTLSWVGYKARSFGCGLPAPCPNSRGSRQDSLGNCSFQLRAKGTEKSPRYYQHGPVRSENHLCTLVLVPDLRGHHLLCDTLTSSVTFQTPDVTKQSWKLKCPKERKRSVSGVRP